MILNRSQHWPITFFESNVIRPNTGQDLSELFEYVTGAPF